MKAGMIESFEQCCEVATAVIDGKYGWRDEALSLIVFVVIFNFFAKWLLKRLHKRFESTKQIWKDAFVQALYSPLSTFTWIFAGIHALNLIFPSLSSDSFFRDIHLLLEITAIICIAWFIMLWKKNLIRLMTLKSKRHEISWNRSKIDVINKAITIVVMFITILLLMEITGRSISTIIAFGGIGGLAIAFASQEVIANFFSGLMIYLTHPFGVGDWIYLKEKDIEGHVEEIGWYTTRVRTMEKRPMYVPNSIFSKVVVETPSRMSHRELKETIHLRYKDMQLIKPITDDITAMLDKHQYVDNDQKISVTLGGFGTYSLDVLVTAYVTILDSEEYALVKQELLFLIIDILTKHGAEMAAPITIVEVPKPIQINNLA